MDDKDFEKLKAEVTENLRKAAEKEAVYDRWAKAKADSRKRMERMIVILITITLVLIVAAYFIIGYYYGTL